MINNHVASQSGENEPVSFFALDREWRFTALNQDAAEHFHHVGPEDLIGKVLWEVDPAINGTALEATYREAMEMRDVLCVDMKGVTTGRWFNVSIHPSPDGISILWQDIQEMKNHEQLLLESEERFRSLVASIAQTVWETDTSGQINLDSSDLPTPAEPAGDRIAVNRWYENIHPDDRAEVETTWRDAVAAAWNITVEYRTRTANGSWQWIQVHAAPIHDQEGRIKKWVGMNIDISKRKQAEEELRKADEYKSAFLNTLSHELRNPLASIMMGLSLLERLSIGGDPEEKAGRIIALMDRQTTLLTRLVDDLLDVSRLANARIMLKKQPVEINRLVQQAVADHQELFTEKAVDLQVEQAETPLYLDADPVRLTQAIGNLLHNAAKFTASGDMARVTVREDTWQSEVVITVQDTGIGIDPAVLPGLFQPFVQADTSLDHGGGGLGLGLSIVKGIVELHGGSVSVGSAGLGLGSLFTIRLPLSRRNPDQNPSASRTGSSTEPALRILVIEDNPDLTELLFEVLHSAGHVVQIAANGQSGVAQALVHKPDVIICDIGLPGMSGFEVVKTIRSLPVLQKVLMIAFSGYARPEDFALSRAAGFDHHLAKPIDMEILNRLLTECRRRSQAACQHERNQEPCDMTS